MKDERYRLFLYLHIHDAFSTFRHEWRMAAGSEQSKLEESPGTAGQDAG